ncbi:MAG: DNA polymerase III subunit delta [Christensenellales bacterium]
MRAFEIDEKLKYGAGTIYFLDGNDSMLKTYVINALKNTLEPADREDGVFSYDGDFDLGEILANANMVSLFGGKKIIVCSDYQKTLSDRERANISDYAENPNEDCILVFKDCGKTFDCIKDYAIFVNCNKAEKSELCAYVGEILTKKGYTADKSAIYKLVEFCDSDLGKIINETDKLTMYCLKERKITVEDVEGITPVDVETKIFELSNAVQRGDSQKALEIWDFLLKKGEKPSALLNVITTSFRKSFLISNTNADDEIICRTLDMSNKALQVNKSIIAKNKSAKQGYVPYLKKIVDELARLEYKFKSGQIVEESALSIAITRLIAKRS